MRRRVFFVSDRTGITAENLGETLLTQFPDFEFTRTRRPFIDSEAKARDIVAQIDQAAVEDGAPPLVFSTLTDPDCQDIIAASRGSVFELFGTFIGPMEQTLKAHSTHKAGRMHGISDQRSYERRIQALNFTLDHDDGQRVQGLEAADVVLMGVSRCGKTPTSLYLAMQFNLRAANYPLTDDDLDATQLPAVLRPCREKLFGLTIKPERLARIREERRPDSRYASLQQCRSEVARAESLMRAAGVPFLDTTTISIEEIATTVVQRFRPTHD
jgi:regulator of PEP synthase PpsR (kinase-PPPase family)